MLFFKWPIKNGLNSVITSIFVLSLMITNSDAKITNSGHLEDDSLSSAEAQNQTLYQVDLVVIPQPEEVIKMSTTNEGFIVEQVNAEEDDDEDNDRLPYILGNVKPYYVNGIQHLFDSYFGSDAAEYTDQSEQDLIKKAQAIRALGIFTH